MVAPAITLNQTGSVLQASRSLSSSLAVKKLNKEYKNEFKIILSMIKKYNIILDCYNKAEYFINLASNSLSVFEESKEKNIFKNLTSFSLERTF